MFDIVGANVVIDIKNQFVVFGPKRDCGVNAPTSYPGSMFYLDLVLIEFVGLQQNGSSVSG